MNTCKSCRHWDRDSAFNGAAECKMVVDFPRTDDDDNPLPDEPTDRIFDYHKASTGPDFGCIHHSPIEPTERIPEWRML